jgi:WD40 repeat protein
MPARSTRLLLVVLLGLAAGPGRADPVGGRLTLTFNGRPSSVNAVAFAPAGRLLASGGGDGLVRLWDLEKLRH